MTWFDVAMMVQRFPIRAARERMRELLAMSPDMLRNWNESQRWEMAKHHHESNPYYRELVGPRLPTDWEALPVVTKQDFQKPLTSLLSQRVSAKRLYVASTSGSTGHPFYFAKDKLSHALSWELVHSRYSLYGLRPDSLQARFYGIPLSGLGYWKERLKDSVARRVRFPVFDLSDPALDAILDTFRRRAFEYIYGYTSAVVRFAERALRLGVTLREVCPTLKAAIVTSEVCSHEDRQTIGAALGGLPVVNEYGASELGVMAFEFPDGVMRCSDELVYLETRPDEHGVLRLLCTSLTNLAFPLIRYNIGDAVTLSVEDQRTVISALDGRVNDFAVLPSGRVAAGLTFYYIARRVLESQASIREFVVRQTQRDRFEFDVVAQSQLGLREIQLLERSLTEYLEPGLKLVVNYVDAIRRGPNGKLRHFTSLVERPMGGKAAESSGETWRRSDGAGLAAARSAQTA